MTEAWVTNASPLIFLTRIGRLDLFEQLALNVLVPDAVIAEVRQGQAKDPTAPAALAWAAPRRIANITVPASVEHWDVGAGESQVIAHALGGSHLCVLDDRGGRRCADAHGLRVIGTLGVVLRAKGHGLLAEARPWIEKLVDSGMFVDPGLVDAALALVGE